MLGPFGMSLVDAASRLNNLKQLYLLYILKAYTYPY